jgi:hypothetical protein
MSSKQISTGEGEDTLGAVVSGSNDSPDVLDQELAQLPAGPPFDLNNFPFTFEDARDTASSTIIEPDVRMPISVRGKPV